jgi:hypothetical protein
VEISSPELQSRCGTFSTFDTPTGLTTTTTLDDDGNAVFYFEAASCGRVLGGDGRRGGWDSSHLHDNLQHGGPGADYLRGVLDGEEPSDAS